MHLTITCYDHKDHSRLKREEMNKIRLYVSILTSTLPSFLNTEVSQLTRFATLLPPSGTVLYNEDCLKHSLIEDCLKYRLILFLFHCHTLHTCIVNSLASCFLSSSFVFCLLSQFTHNEIHVFDKNTPGNEQQCSKHHHQVHVNKWKQNHVDMPGPIMGPGDRNQGLFLRKTKLGGADLKEWQWF